MRSLLLCSLGLGLCLPLAAQSTENPPPAPAKTAAAPAKTVAKARDLHLVGCTASKVFHRPRCKAVAEIDKAGTKVRFTWRQEATQAGYKPCEACKS